jgi:hypothetical protein
VDNVTLKCLHCENGYYLKTFYNSERKDYYNDCWSSSKLSLAIAASLAGLLTIAALMYGCFKFGLSRGVKKQKLAEKQNFRENNVQERVFEESPENFKQNGNVFQNTPVFVNKQKPEPETDLPSTERRGFLQENGELANPDYSERGTQNYDQNTIQTASFKNFEPPKKFNRSLPPILQAPPVLRNTTSTIPEAIVRNITISPNNREVVTRRVIRSSLGPGVIRRPRPQLALSPSSRVPQMITVSNGPPPPSMKPFPKPKKMPVIRRKRRTRVESPRAMVITSPPDLASRAVRPLKQLKNNQQNGIYSFGSKQPEVQSAKFSRPQTIPEKIEGNMEFYEADEAVREREMRGTQDFSTENYRENEENYVSPERTVDKNIDEYEERLEDVLSEIERALSDRKKPNFYSDGENNSEFREEDGNIKVSIVGKNQKKKTKLNMNLKRRKKSIKRKPIVIRDDLRSREATRGMSKDGANSMHFRKKKKTSKMENSHSFGTFPDKMGPGALKKNFKLSQKMIDHGLSKADLRLQTDSKDFNTVAQKRNWSNNKNSHIVLNSDMKRRLDLSKV